MWKTISSGKVWRGEIRNRKKNGDIYWVATTIVPIFDKQEKPSRYLSIRSEITEQKIAEEKLKISENRFKNLYQNIKEDLQLAAETQKYLMPTIKSIPGFQWKAYVRPLVDVSGDLITMRVNNDESLDIFLADIAGHGVSSALISAVVVLAFHQMEDQIIDKHGNTSECLLTIRETIQGIQMGEFVCGVFLHLDTKTKILSYSYAGQLPGVLYRDGELIILEGKGMPLFSNGDIILNNYTKQLLPGDQVLFFSDGVYEIFNADNDLLDYDGFMKVVESAFNQKNIHVVEHIEDSIMRYSLESPSDDISMFYLYCE